MATDPNDKMRTPGAARRRDMDGRAYRSQKKGCRNAAVLLLVAALGITANGAFDVFEAIRLVTS